MQSNDIQPIARAICAALGASLKHDEGNTWYASAVLPDGVTIGLHMGHGSKARLEASVSLPDRITTRDVIEYAEEKAGTFTTRISCDPAREAAAIARDITRRLLPDAVTLTARAIERKRKNDEWTAGRDATLTMLAKRLGCEPRHGDQLYPGSVTVRVSGPDSVSIERIYCTGETAARIVELLKADKVPE